MRDHALRKNPTVKLPLQRLAEHEIEELLQSPEGLRRVFLTDGVVRGQEPPVRGGCPPDHLAHELEFPNRNDSLSLQVSSNQGPDNDTLLLFSRHASESITCKHNLGQSTFDDAFYSPPLRIPALARNWRLRWEYLPLGSHELGQSWPF